MEARKDYVGRLIYSSQHKAHERKKKHSYTHTNNTNKVEHIYIHQFQTY